MVAVSAVGVFCEHLLRMEPSYVEKWIDAEDR